MTDINRLTDALKAIGSAVNDALAAIDTNDEPEAVTVAEVPDYHAQELERIQAQADATVAVIQAEADADVARIQAASDAAPDPIEQADDELDEAAGDFPAADDDVAPIDDAGDALDIGQAVDDAGDVLDALPTLDPVDEVLPDVVPAAQHWYKRKIRIF